MKPHNQGGVVDEQLNVYGVENLKVAGTKTLGVILMRVVVLEGARNGDLTMLMEMEMDMIEDSVRELEEKKEKMCRQGLDQHRGVG